MLLFTCLLIYCLEKTILTFGKDDYNYCGCNVANDELHFCKDEV